MYRDYSDILNHYLAQSRRLAGDYTAPSILKTDLHNEANDQPVKGGIVGNLHGDIYALEIDPQIYKTAAQKVKGHLKRGDIRDLPYQDQSFDLVLDLSTIDHVPFADIEGVLRGYRRVLKDGGCLYLVVWLDISTDGQRQTKPTQYVFGEGDFLAKMGKVFSGGTRQTIAIDVNCSDVRLVEFISYVGLR